jgi:hypothetical protein
MKGFRACSNTFCHTTQFLLDTFIRILRAKLKIVIINLEIRTTQEYTFVRRLAIAKFVVHFRSKSTPRMLHTPSNSHDEATSAYGLHPNSQILSGRLNSCKIVLISQLLPPTRGMFIYQLGLPVSAFDVGVLAHTFQNTGDRGPEHILVLGSFLSSWS